MDLTFPAAVCPLSHLPPPEFFTLREFDHFVVVRRSRLPFLVCLASGESGEKQRPSVKRPKKQIGGELAGFSKKEHTTSSSRSRFELK